MAYPITEQEITVYEGSDFIADMSFDESDGSAANFTGATLYMDLRVGPDEALIQRFSTATGELAVTAADTVRLHIPGEDIAAWSVDAMMYDIFVILSGDPFVIGRGTIVREQRITEVPA